MGGGGGGVMISPLDKHLVGYNLRSGPILAASIHSLLCGHGQLYDENFSQVKLKLNFIFLIVSKSLT